MPKEGKPAKLALRLNAFFSLEKPLAVSPSPLSTIFRMILVKILE
jgi:hypothetical protein